MATALKDLRVIDFTHHYAGPYCTKLLAGFGAEVIKIERPETGDPLRQQAPFYGVEKATENNSHTERSIPFLWLNTGKKSLTLDLKNPHDHAQVIALIKQADIVVENFAPGVMARLGLGYEQLSQINPHLVMVAISNFGQSGPYRDYKAEEIQLNAISGLMDNTGSPNREPLSAGPAINQYTAGLHAYLAIMAAITQGTFQGAGQYIDISIMESSVEQIENRVNAYLFNGTVASRGPHAFAPWGNYTCKDGEVTIISAPFRHWPHGAKIFAQPELTEKKFHHVRDRIKQRPTIDALIQPWLNNKNKVDIFAEGQNAGLSFGYVAELDEVLESPQHHARDFFVELEHPVVGTHQYCDAPFRMYETPWQTTRAPLLGEHNGLLTALINERASATEKKSQGFSLAETRRVKNLKLEIC